MSPLCDARNSAWFVLYVSADGLLYPNGAVAMLLLCIPGSEQRFLPLFSPPPLPTGDSAPPLLSSLRGMGILRAETILASLTFKSSSWQPGARVEPVLGKSEWMSLGGSRRNCPGLGRVDGREEGREGPCRNLKHHRLELSARAPWVLSLSPRACHQI